MKQVEVMKMLEHIFGKKKLESNAQARKIKLQLMVMCEEYLGIGEDGGEERIGS